MGLWLSRFMDVVSGLLRGSEPMRVCLVGLDSAGKTTILYKMKLNETVQTIPTVGFNVETFSPGKGLTFTVWDVSAQSQIIPLWRHYFGGTTGFIFVVDSHDVDRMEETKEALFRYVLDCSETKVPIVIMANKQDLPNSLSPDQVSEKLGLANIKDRPWTIQATCATTGEGLCEAFQHLGDMIEKQRRDEKL